MLNDWVLLIDFGTSFSRAAIVDADGRVEPVEVDGAVAVPSGVWADAKGRLISGVPALRQARLAPERWNRAPKRSLGQAKLSLGSAEVAVSDAVAAVLKQLSAEAIRRRGGAPRAVRLICPARWDAARRETLLVAARSAGLDAPKVTGGAHLVDAPFAVSRLLAERNQLPAESKIALFDLGGGGVETAVIEAAGAAGSGTAGDRGSAGDQFVVRALGGIAGLGGECFDDLLFQQVAVGAFSGQDSARLLDPPDAEWRRSAEGLFREVRRAKEELSRSHSVRLDHGTLMPHSPLQLNRIPMEALLRPEVLRSARELATTIELAGLRPRTLDAVYLIGGASQMPMVSRVIYDVLGVTPTVLDESGFLAGAAGWTPQDRIDPNLTRTTPAGRTLQAQRPTILPTTGSIPVIRPLAATAVPPTPAPQPSAPQPSAPQTSATALIAMPPAPPGTPVPAAEPGPDHPGPIRLDPAPPTGRPVWRRPVPVLVVVVAVIVVALLLGGFALNDGDAATTGAATGAGPTPSPSPTPEPTPSATLDVSDSLLPVAGLTAHTKKITVTLRWSRVDGADSYQVVRDGDTPAEVSQPVAGTRFADRPGDGDRHTYRVVALDVDGNEGPVGNTVRPPAAATPYGAEQDIASVWITMIPEKSGAKGKAGQTCKGTKASSEHSNGRIVCRLKNGLQYQILRFASKKQRDARVAQLTKAKGAHAGRWSVKGKGSRAKKVTGQLITAGAKAPNGPWRVWTFDDRPTYAMSVQWPKHSAKALAQWWQKKAPFQS
jgi:hypothetical protein